MSRFTKRSAKLSMLLMFTTVAVCLMIVIALDWTSSWTGEDRGYYVVSMNGEEIGVAKSQEDIDNALLAARLKINEEEGTVVYSDPDIEVTRERRIFANALSKDELEENFYSSLVSDLNDTLVRAYVVNIDDFSVTLASKDEVVDLLNAVKDKYDVINEFDVDLVEDGDGYYSAITFDVIHSDTEVNAAATNVFASIYSSSAADQPTAVEEGYEDGIIDLSFAEDVEIVESYVSDKSITDLDDAIEMVTKEQAQKQVYVVQEGDCLSSIASKFDISLKELLAVNPDFTEESMINIGDKVVVTVPRPELSVVVKEERTYEETYSADVQYVENDSMFTNEKNVISEGTPGYRRVVAVITYKNGQEQSREIIHQTVLTESTPTVIEVGTIVPPTYVKPVSGGSLSSPFGARWGTVHKGVDWFVGMGTTVYASCGGTVVQAGWNGGYGYCVTMQHADGKQTRYAHLSSIACSVGQHLDQYEVLGYSGSTGDSTGPHLHFEIIVNGSQVDPLPFL